MLQRLLRDDHAAATGRLATAERPAHLHRLAGDHRGDRVAMVHRVRVHHPRHHALVRVHVGRGHVGVRAERVDDTGGVATREALELPDAHFVRIADHAAFRTAERQIHDGAFPAHPRRERLHFLERDLHVEADAALRGTTHRVVQHAKARVHLELAIVHHHRYGHDDLLLGVAQDLVEAGLEIEELSGPIEPAHHRLERVLLVEEPVLVGMDDSAGRRTEVGCHAR